MKSMLIVTTTFCRSVDSSARVEEVSTGAPRRGHRRAPGPFRLVRFTLGLDVGLWDWPGRGQELDDLPPLRAVLGRARRRPAQATTGDREGPSAGKVGLALPHGPGQSAVLYSYHARPLVHDACADDRRRFARAAARADEDSPRRASRPMPPRRASRTRSFYAGRR